MKKITTSQLVPGMITAKDIVSHNGQVILPKGLMLTDKSITKLSFYSIQQVCIEEDSIEVTDLVSAPSSYEERIQASPEFQKFQSEFRKDVRTLKTVVNDVVKQGAPFDIDKLMMHTLSVVESGFIGSHVFDMLHCIREYDDATYVHCINVALICNIFARWLRMKPDEIRLATLCGLLHDVGKTKIPNTIIQKPGKLTEQEFDIVKSHPLEGYRMLQNLNLNPSILNAALMHHEKCDGSGYPYGLTGDKIDPYAKMVTIADIYDAMTSARIYRGPLCPFKAIALFETEGLQKYDPKYILTFLENVVNSYLLSQVRLSNGMTGKIIYINPRRLSAPVIQSGQDFFDLSRHPEVFIEDIL